MKTFTFHFREQGGTRWNWVKSGSQAIKLIINTDHSDDQISLPDINSSCKINCTRTGQSLPVYKLHSQWLFSLQH